MNELLAWIAALLAQRGCGVFNPPTAFGPDDVGIVIGVVPQKPDRLIVLSDYVNVAGQVLPVDTIGVQVRTRGSADPRVVSAIDDSVFDVLQGLTQQDAPLHIVRAWLGSSTTLGQDTAGRHERSSNYSLDVIRVTANRPHL